MKIGSHSFFVYTTPSPRFASSPLLLPSPSFLIPPPCFRLLLLLPSPLCFLLLLAWSYPPCLRRVGVGIIKEKGLTSVLLMRPLRREGFALGPKGRFHKAERLKAPPSPWGETPPNITKKGNPKVTFVSGERGIRTPGTSQCGSFQDCCNRPLYHLSRCPLWAAFFSKAMQRYGFFLKQANVSAVFLIFFLK